MMTKKMSLLLTGMLLCLAPDIKGNETDGRIKGIVMRIRGTTRICNRPG